MFMHPTGTVKQLRGGGTVRPRVQQPGPCVRAGQSRTLPSMSPEAIRDPSQRSTTLSNIPAEPVIGGPNGRPLSVCHSRSVPSSPPHDHPRLVGAQSHRRGTQDSDQARCRGKHRHHRSPHFGGGPGQRPRDQHFLRRSFSAAGNFALEHCRRLSGHSNGLRASQPLHGPVSLGIGLTRLRLCNLGLLEFPASLHPRTDRQSGNDDHHGRGDAHADAKPPFAERDALPDESDLRRVEPHPRVRQLLFHDGEVRIVVRQEFALPGLHELVGRGSQLCAEDQLVLASVVDPLVQGLPRPHQHIVRRLDSVLALDDEPGSGALLMCSI